MPIANDSREAEKIRQFIPLATLPLAQFESVCARINILSAAAGETLFKIGDNNKNLIYLLSGEVSLQSTDMQVEIIQAESYSGRFALAHHVPRKIDALALCALHYISIDADWLISPTTHLYQEDPIDMSDTEPDANPEDWMTTLLNSPVFKNLPPANLQKLLMSLEEVRALKGAVILKQGDAGEFYYFIKQGHCILSRKPSPNARDIKLAQLRAGDTFGEDALLSDQPTSVTVTALTDLFLLRLNKEKFITLIKTPTLKYVLASALVKEMAAGACIVDVRAPDDFIAWHLQGSINAPAFTLLMQLKTFDRKKPVIVVCDDGKASAAAAFLLLRNKFNVKILQDGLRGLPTESSGDGVVSFVRNAEMGKNFLEQPVVAASGELVEHKVEGVTLESVLLENKQLKMMVLKLRQQCATFLQEKAVAEKLYQDLVAQAGSSGDVLSE